MTKQITLYYYSMEGSGPTVKEAKLDAGRKIEAALYGDHTPTIITKTNGAAKYTVIIFRDLARYGYEFIKHGENDRRHYPAANYDNEHDALIHAFRHIAQNEFSLDDDGSQWIADTDHEGLREHKSWAIWHHKYNAWKSIGKTDNEAFDLAWNWPPDYTPTCFDPNYKKG